MCTTASQEGAEALSPDCIVVHGRYVSQEHLLGMLHHLWKVPHEPAGEILSILTPHGRGDAWAARFPRQGTAYFADCSAGSRE